MITIFVLELSAGISGYVLRNEAGQMLRANLKTTMEEYKTYAYITRLWDEVQTDVRICRRIFRSSMDDIFIILKFLLQFKCCGLDEAKDWMNVPVNDIPISCCSFEAGS